jgi:2-dehydro-3-deoxygluconokinase
MMWASAGFTYWRGESAARRVFSCAGIHAALAAAEYADLLAFSLISLAVLPPEGRDALLALAGMVRRHGWQVAFDGNFRPRLWADPAEARAARDAAIAVATIGLPTLEDETMLSGERDAAGGCCALAGARLHGNGRQTGAGGLQAARRRNNRPSKVLRPVDTSGAGDAFNAGYLGARLRGKCPADAATAGHAFAGWTIMRRGAIPPRDL